MLHRIALCLLVFLSSSVVKLMAGTETVIPPKVIISVRDQKLMVIDNGQRAAVYPISTSKFGLGDRWGSMATPLGWLQVAKKIGDHAPSGAVFHNRRFTGEIIPPNAPGRDPIVTRIIWLRGLEKSNANAFNRGIYIHGTPQEKKIGKPASYGCVRMSSKDVAEVYAQIQIGALVRIIPDSLPKLPKAKASSNAVVFSADAPRGKPAPPLSNPAPAGKSDSAGKRVSAQTNHGGGHRA
ncbi:MAG TPA: L,D-transpeptidase [Chthoniobacterales bacterium]|jgi:lipoprotein-anchoring transpeptidase ErfK/SrfK|nr:L,D-transpeptidase [Chthoniobacterales bacterium]